MNPIGLCATDAKSLVAVIKAAQKARIKKIMCPYPTFESWWGPFKRNNPDSDLTSYLQLEKDSCGWADVGLQHTMWIKIWPATMNPEGF